MTKPRNPPVTKGRKPDKLLRDALILALMREAEDGEGRPTRRLALIADRLVEKGMAGDIAAIKEIMDRVDGKPSAATDEDAPQRSFRPFRVVIVDPKQERETGDGG